ncbi:MAG: glycosyltransferase family 39 protein [Elusimicrobia bacterium]|nr:glycosyltransferase family 39 protein [Elusimicrobiota bacterium]
MASPERERCIPCEDGRRLLVLALIARLGWAVVSNRFWGWRDDLAYDDGVFLHMARAFLGLEPQLTGHPPGYPLFLAPFLAVGGDLGLSLARWATIAAGALAPALTYRVALRLRATRTAALVAGALVALDPMMIYFSARLMSESLFTALVLGFLYAWLYAWEAGAVRSAALAGVLGGAASLTRGTMLPFGGVLALVALWRRREQPRWAALVAVCGLCWAGTIAPWTFRNWRVYHRFVPVSVQGGWNFYEGLTVDPEQIRHARAEAMGAEARALGLDSVQADEYFAAKSKAFIREDPGEFLRLCAVKAARFWRPAPEPPHGLLTRVAAGAFTLLLFAGALLGLRAASRATGAWFALAWIAHLNLLHAVFASNLRYRLPVEPVVAVLAGIGLAALLR